MAIITISRGSYSKGIEVAEGVAAKLSYRCISREVLLEASKKFSVPEVRLLHAMHDGPSVLERFGRGTQSYILYVQSALLDSVRKGNVVYHGLAGHILLKEIASVLRVRIIADIQTRISVVSERENVGPSEAKSMIARIDEERKKWSRILHGVNPWDPSLYDLVISIDKIGVQGAVDLICQAAAREPFLLSDTARREIEDLALAISVKSHLLEIDQNVQVISEYGNVLVYTTSTNLGSGHLEKKVAWLLDNIKGINNIEIHMRAGRTSSDA
jgi:cytidylate kinase